MIFFSKIAIYELNKLPSTEIKLDWIELASLVFFILLKFNLFQLI
jgi:hypothetical protein